MIKKVPKIHYATCTDELRPALQHILITKKNIIASNLYILVIHETKNVFDKQLIDDLPDRCLIHRENWKILARGHYDIIYNKEAKCFDVVGRNTKFFIKVEFEEKIGNFPDYNYVMNKWEKGSIDSIGISPELLYDLGRAMDCKNTVELKFHNKNRGILVKSEFAKGLIMPRIIDWDE